MAAMLRIGFLGALAVPGLFAPCLALDPSVKVQTRAVEAIDGGRADEAVDLLERATAEDPGAIVLLDLLGKAYLKTGQESLAEEIAERILRAFPDRHPTRLWLGQLLERQGRLREARRHYRILVAAPQAVPEAKELAAIGLARSHLRDREHAEAWRVMASFLEKKPGGDAVLGSLRSAEPEAGDRELETARRALETDGSPLPGPEALVPVARALRAEGKRAQAIRVLEKLILARGALEEPAGLLGDLYLETGREADALALAEAWQREAPGSRFGELLLLRALDAQGRDAEAFAEAERLIAEHAREPDWAAPLLEVLIALDGSLEVLEAWRRTGPDPPPAARGALARLFRRAGGRALAEGDPRKAVELIGEAVRLVPGDGAARRELGWAQLRAENPAAAFALWKPLLESPGDTSQLQSGAVKALRSLGSVGAEVAHASRALAEDPENAALRKWYWALLEEAGRTRELLDSLNPEALPGSDPATGPAVAAVLGRRRREPAFRALLERWHEKLPADPWLEKAHAKAVREEKLLVRTGAQSGDPPELLEEPEDRAEEENLSRLETARGSAPAPAPPPVPQPATGAAPSAGGPVASGGKGPPSLLRDASLLLVDGLFGDGRLEQALAVLAEIARQRPGDEKLLVRFLRAASHAGKAEWAVRHLEGLQNSFPNEPAPRSVLLQRRVERQDLERAQELLRRYLERFPRDADKWFMLGEVQLDQEDPASAKIAFASAGAFAPENFKAKIGLAVCELELGNFREALVLLDAILDVNPRFEWARAVRIKVLALSGDLEGAIREWEEEIETLPNDEDLLFLKAEVLSAAERYREALLEIQRVLDLADGGALPVLLYHGISAHFESDAVPAPLFRDQLRALRDAGYVTVGLRDLEDWMGRRRQLPPKAILITFDDARLDNLLVADGILQEFGFRAVEFVPTGFVRGERSFYLSWNDLRKLAASGRWEFGAHGHLAHRPVIYQADGTRGNFLVTRRWIPEDARNESLREMEERIRTDHWNCQKKLEEELGLPAVAAYAYPFGSFGQRDLTNEPEAAPLNLRLLGERYRFAFIQNEFGYNLPGRGPLLCRFSVPENWDGKRLLAHLRESHPRVRALLKRAGLYSNRGESLACLKEVDRAEALGASPRQVWKIRGRTLLWRGDKLGALDAFQQLVLLDPTSPQAREALEEAERPLRPSASLKLWWSLDQEDREIFQQTARGEINIFPKVRLHAEGGHARYSESHVPATEAAIGEVGALVLPLKELELEGAVGEHWFDGADDKVHYSAAARGKLLDVAELEGGAAGGPVETPRAILRGIRLDAQSANASFNLTSADDLTAFFQHGIYSDSNVRDTFRLEYGHRIRRAPDVRLGVDTTFDDSRKKVPEYYSPDDLQLYRLFARLDTELTEGFRLTTRLAGGYGWEDRHGRAVANALLRLRWILLRRLELSGDLSYLLNPHYWEVNIGPTLTLHF